MNAAPHPHQHAPEHPARLPRATWLLCAAQAINLTAAVISVTIAALVGTRLASSPSLATLPYGSQFAVMMLCTYPASMLMRRFGRRLIFCIAALLLCLSGAVGMQAVDSGSFSGLVLAHSILGVYIACANFYRFAAVDNVEIGLRPKALSLVIAGGLIAALLGPAIASALREVPGHAEFAWCYGSLMLLGALTLALMLVWRPAQSSTQVVIEADSDPVQSNTGPIITAIFCAAAGYLLMNLLMVQSSLVMKDFCSFSESSHAIRIHIIAMFAPSFITGPIINRIGLRQTLLLGFGLLIASAIFGSLQITYLHMLVTLVLLGLGWNFTYIGGGALLAQSTHASSHHRWQGINDTLVAVFATLGAFLPAPLLASAGWNLTNAAAIPLCLIGIVLCWKTLRQPSQVTA